MSKKLLGRICKSSAKFQDNLFDKNATPPSVISALGKINDKNNGVIEAYIYEKFEEKYLQLENALGYCTKNGKESFKLSVFLDQFWSEPGLKRSVDKIFEIVVFSLFETLGNAIDIKIDIYFNPEKSEILKEFSGFSEKVLSVNPKNNRKTLNGHFYRVGVTNAADRGSDMYANFGTVVQIKHLTLDEDVAENIVTSIASDRIIIVCKAAEKKIIASLLGQIGWRSRIQSIITIDELTDWYEKALTGKYADLLGDILIKTLTKEIRTEFPSIGGDLFQEFKSERGYDKMDAQKLIHSFLEPA